MDSIKQAFSRAYKITVPHGMQTYIGNLFKVGQPFVHKALHQEKNSKKAQAIRAKALEMGGYWERKMIPSPALPKRIPSPTLPVREGVRTEKKIKFKG